VLPALLARLDRAESRADIFDIAVKLAVSESIPPEHAAALASLGLSEVRQLRRRAPESFDWRTRNLDAALDRRRRAERALTMIGHAPPTARAIEALTSWLDRDPVCAGAAVVSLVRLGGEPDPVSVARVSGDPEARRSLFDALRELERLDLIPARDRTQEALAEAELVEWLTYPAELGRPPDEIRFAEVITAETIDGPADLYVFRVRDSDPDSDGPSGSPELPGPTFAPTHRRPTVVG
jgi:hypothetical protein